MTGSSIAGSRIRDRRQLAGIRQTDLAREVGISASYLNLIEHNRRRIGGKLLLRIAGVLDVDPSVISEGAEATLVAGLRETAGDQESRGVELDSVEEFAGRFPGWAQLLTDTHRRNVELERSVESLTDRLAHDPHLAESLHEVLSVVTAIRSTASILADTRSLEAEWQARFHRNINEDSQRLAEGAESLVRYLDAAPGTEADIKSPQDEVDAFLDAHGYHFPSLEAQDDRAEERVDQLLAKDRLLKSAPALKIAHDILNRYQADAGRVPLKPLISAIAVSGVDPAELAMHFGVDLPCMLRRLAMLPSEAAGPTGLLVCDASGTLIMHKPFDDFAVSRMAGACPVWPLFRALAQPQIPFCLRIRQAGRAVEPVTAVAVAEPVAAARYNSAPILRSYMLLMPDRQGHDMAQEPEEVGTSCRICPRGDCAARREPSITQDGF